MATTSKYPFTWRELTEEEKAERRKFYNGPLTKSGEDVVVSQPGNIIVPKNAPKLLESIYNMEVRPDDVWVVTYPKCGTTWTQEMVWQIRHNFDVEGGRQPLNARFPFVEIEMFFDGDGGEMSMPEEMRVVMAREKLDRSFAHTQSLASPRCIKSHLPLDMLPPALLDTAKVVFVSRNPKDCCVSYFHHERLGPQMGFAGEFKDYARFFKEGKLVLGDYWYHLEQAWKNRHHPNLKILWYEDMKADLKTVIRETSQFLGRHLTELKVLQLDDHLYFDNFKKNPAVNFEVFNNPETGQAFIRKGAVGDWKNHFTPEVAEEWNKWIAQKKVMHGIEYDFKAI